MPERRRVNGTGIGRGKPAAIPDRPPRLTARRGKSEVAPTARRHTGAMPKLITPDTGVHASFVAAMAEFRAEGRGGADDDSMVGHEIRRYGDHWLEPAGFAGYVEDLKAQARPGPALPERWVPSTTLWYAQDDTYLGRLAIRHSLTEWLLNYGGHIGYDVRPTARRRGHATAMLREALPLARALGITSVLITCDTTNVASRKVIEACGGVLEDERGGRLRFLVPAENA